MPLETGTTKHENVQLTHIMKPVKSARPAVVARRRRATTAQFLLAALGDLGGVFKINRAQY